MALRKGGEAIKKASERNSGDFQARNWIRWEEDEQKTIRFLTDMDDIITVWVHEYVQGHGNKTGSLICRREFGKDCELCEADVKRREKSYGIAVEREAVYNSKTNKLKGFRDVKVEVTIEGEEKEVPLVGIVAQAAKNFWSKFYVIHDRYSTITDRDYDIKRVGKSMDTDYHIFPNPESTLKNPEKYDELLPDIEEMLEHMASDEYYDRLLRGITPEKNEKKGKGRKAAPKAQDDDDDELEDEDSTFAKLKEQKEKLKKSARVEATADDDDDEFDSIEEAS